MAIPFSELNKINPSSVIELFELELTVGLHVPSGNPNNLDTVFRFHAGANLNNFGMIRYLGQDYQRVAVKVEGFEDTSTGTIPRPTLTFSNLGGITKDTTVMTMSDFLAIVNTTTPGNDLLDAKVTRRTLTADALDASNFSGGTNPFGTPSSNEFPKEIHFIDRKIQESRDIVSFELVNRLDMENKKVPARQVTRKDFEGVGTFVN